MSVAVDIHAGELSGDRYCILRGALDTSAIEALAADLAPSFELTHMCQGVFHGNRTRHFGAPLRRSPRAEDLVRHPVGLEVAEGMHPPWPTRIGLNHIAEER